MGLLQITAERLRFIKGGIEARLRRIPGIFVRPFALANTVTAVGHPLILAVPVDEIVMPVFFAGQIGAPGCNAHGTVVEGADHGLAIRVGHGFHQPMAGQRAADFHLGEA